MRRESHVRIWESGGVRFPSATRLSPRLCVSPRGAHVAWPVPELLQQLPAALFA